MQYFLQVNYLIFIGGFNAKESIGLCVKEVFQDSLMISYTWYGREENQRPLYNTRLVKAIYGMILLYIILNLYINDITILIIMFFRCHLRKQKFCETNAGCISNIYAGCCADGQTKTSK